MIIKRRILIMGEIFYAQKSEKNCVITIIHNKNAGIVKIPAFFPLK
jgi:hypothetical protein